DDFFFFFQAEDGIRDWSVTGVQTCALPILIDQAMVGRQVWPGVDVTYERTGTTGLKGTYHLSGEADASVVRLLWRGADVRIAEEIGRASCRERGESGGVGGGVKREGGERSA